MIVALCLLIALGITYIAWQSWRMRHFLRRSKELKHIMLHMVAYAVYIDTDEYAKNNRLDWLEQERRRWAELCEARAPLLEALRGRYANDFRAWYLIADAANKSHLETLEELKTSWLEELREKYL